MNILDGLADGVLAFDSDRICVYANAAASRLLSTPTEVVLGQPIRTVLRPAALQLAYRRVETSHSAEMLDDDQGDGRCHRFRLVPHDEGVVVFLRDRDEPAQALTRRGAPGLIQQVLDFAPVAVTLADLDGRLRLVNRFASTWVGRTAAEVLGHTLAEYVSAELAATVGAAEERVRDTRKPELVTAWSNPPGGDPVRLEIAVFAVFDDAGELTGTGAVYSDVTVHEQVEQALRVAADERRLLLDRLVDAQERERARIAADIHDDSVQALAAVGIRLAALQRTADQDTARAMSGVHESLGVAMSRLRSLLFDLDTPGSDESLAAGIRTAAEFILDPGEVRWTVRDLGTELPYAQRVTALRIAKEALSNVRAHAAASSVTITLRPLDGGVEVTIADDGVGVRPEDARSRPGHRGVTTMRARVGLAGGRLDFERGDPRGTTVRYWLPDGG